MQMRDMARSLQGLSEMPLPCGVLHKRGWPSHLLDPMKFRHIVAGLALMGQAGVVSSRAKVTCPDGGSTLRPFTKPQLTMSWPKSGSMMRASCRFFFYVTASCEIFT